MRIAFFGSSLVSAYWNGAATYYRGIIKALADRGHAVTFYEPDAFGRQQHRDIDNPCWAKVVVYAAEHSAAMRAVEQAHDADLIVKASGVGVFDELLETAVVQLKTSSNVVAFWDVDAPATLESMTSGRNPSLKSLVPRFDLIFTYGGGDPVVNAYKALGARECVPVYNALDPSTHYPVLPDSRFECDLAFLGNRLPDREARVEEFFWKPARKAAHKRFLLGGAGWGDKERTENVQYLDHVYTFDHNAFNSTPLAVLNVCRESMAQFGYSPATRVFEAAGAGACVITDYWEGIPLFLEPQREVLVAYSGEDVVELLEQLTPAKAYEIGEAAYQRILAEHTYARRAAQIEAVLDANTERLTAYTGSGVM